MSLNNVEYCGVVLAGGLSRRYGSPKAFAKLNEVAYYEIAAQLLADVCEKIVIVSREQYFDRFRETDFVIADEREIVGKGPLAGIYSAMNKVSAHFYVVLPCDMPYMERIILKHLIENKTAEGVTAMTVAGRKHPLVSIWSKTAKEEIREALMANELKVMTVFDHVSVNWLEGSALVTNAESVFKNINKQEDEK